MSLQKQTFCCSDNLCIWFRWYPEGWKPVQLKTHDNRW